MRKPRYLLLVVLSLFLTGGLVYSASVTSGIPVGDEPQALAINPPDNIAVVSTDEALSIVDLNTQSVIAEIPVEEESEGLAIDSGLNIALVANEDEGTFTVIDLYSYEVLGSIPISGEPEAIAVNPLTHIALVADSEDELLVAVDLQTYNVLGYIPLGHEAEDIAIDPELNLALALDENHRSVTVIDLNTWEVTGAVSVGKKPKAIDINPETHLAVVANEKDNSLSVVDLFTWETTTIPVGKHPMDVAVNPLDNRALVICDANEAELKDRDDDDDKHRDKHDEDDYDDKERSLLLVDLSSGTIVAQYAIYKHPEGVAVNPYTNIAGVIDEETESLHLIQLPNPVPVIDSIAPDTLLRGSLSGKVTITGFKFIRTSTVTIKTDTSSHELTPELIDNHTLEVTIPGELLLDTATYQLTVSNPAPEGGTSNAVELVVENPVPQISVLEPMEVEAGTSGLTLNIFGEGFFEDTTFYVNGEERTVNFIKRSKVEMELTASDLAKAGELLITAFNASPGGGTSNTAILTVKPRLEVAITSPLDGATINRAGVMVKGTFKANTRDVGIRVNEVIAEIAGEEWVANNVPLMVGQNTIEAVITDSAGNTAQDAITVYTQDTVQTVSLSANITNGLPPLTVHFSVEAEIPRPISNYRMDFDGDGYTDLTVFGADISNGVSFTYNTEGIYYPTVTVTDSWGVTYSDTIAVTVLSRTEMDALLRGKWESIKQALANGDIEGALTYFTWDSQEMYRYNFNLMSAYLGEILREMGSNMTLAEIEDGRAEYELRVVREGREIAFMVEFWRDFDGRWKLNFF